MAQRPSSNVSAQDAARGDIGSKSTSTGGSKSSGGSSSAERGADVDLLVLKNGGTARIVAHAQLNKSFVNLASNTINLEAGDTLLMESDTSNAITGVISYALIDRSQENG